MIDESPSVRSMLEEERERMTKFIPSSKTLQELKLETRVRKVLEKAGITTVGDLVLNIDWVHTVEGIGDIPAFLGKVNTVLKKVGIRIEQRFTIARL